MNEFECPYRDINGNSVGICVGVTRDGDMLCDYYDVCYPGEKDGTGIFSDEYIANLKELNEYDSPNVRYPRS